LVNPKNPFSPLFNPRSVAVIGASGNSLKMGYQCVLSLKQCAFPGPIYPVHPQEKEILGLPVYKDISQIPGPVELAMLVVPAAEIFPALEACRKKETRGIVIITAGFREIDDPKGEHLQKKLSAFAKRHGIKIIGPNTFGVANLHASLNASFTPFFSRLKKGSISLVSQSGGVAHLIVHQAFDEGVGLGKIVGLGNRCNVDFADLLPYLAEDKETSCIILFVEGQDDPRVLLSAIKNTAPFKPVVAMKAGQSAESARAARSHTGSLAGRYEIYDAALRQAGGIVSQDPGELLDIAKILTILRPVKGKSVAIMTFQAGPGILLTDAVIRSGLSMAVLSKKTQERINRFLPPFTIRTNPVDMAFAHSEEAFDEAARCLLGDRNVDALIVFLLHHPFMSTTRIFGPLLRQKQKSSKPIILCVNAPRGFFEDEVKELEKRGIPVYPLPERAIRALKGLFAYGEIREKERGKEHGAGGMGHKAKSKGHRA
jgi:acetate---CoA ligase (ADP-forming) subunit alpha